MMKIFYVCLAVLLVGIVSARKGKHLLSLSCSVTNTTSGEVIKERRCPGDVTCDVGLLSVPGCDDVDVRFCRVPPQNLRRRPGRPDRAPRTLASLACSIQTSDVSMTRECRGESNCTLGPLSIPFNGAEAVAYFCQPPRDEEDEDHCPFSDRDDSKESSEEREGSSEEMEEEAETDAEGENGDEAGAEEENVLTGRLGRINRRGGNRRGKRWAFWEKFFGEAEKKEGKGEEMMGGGKDQEMVEGEKDKDMVEGEKDKEIVEGEKDKEEEEDYEEDSWDTWWGNWDDESEESEESFGSEESEEGMSSGDSEESGSGESGEMSGEMSGELSGEMSGTFSGAF